MVADTCTFCWEVLKKPTDRINLVEGKGNWSVELNDFPSLFCPYLPTFANEQLNEQLTTLYQQKCAQRGLTFYIRKDTQND